jgi:cell division protein FtsN
MAKKKRKRKRNSARTPEQEPYPGWMWMLFGLSIGLAVAFALYMKEQRADTPAMTAADQPASMAEPMVSPPVPEPVPEAAPDTPEEAASEDEEPRFSFYNMLPNFEVVIPEEESDVRQDREVEPIQDEGTYVLQAGSFGDVSDADRRRAELALLGIESHVQRVAIDDRTYHRVRIGPIDDLDELNLLRARLRQADIDVLRIRLGD